MVTDLPRNRTLGTVIRASPSLISSGSGKVPHRTTGSPLVESLGTREAAHAPLESAGAAAPLPAILKPVGFPACHPPSGVVSSHETRDVCFAVSGLLRVGGPGPGRAGQITCHPEGRRRPGGDALGARAGVR